MITVIVPRPKACLEETMLKRLKEEFKDSSVTLSLPDQVEMTANEYQELAMRTCSIPYDKKRDMLIHATTGLASEAGEFAGLLQKIYQGHDYDREHALKELGDCCWMIAEACKALDAKLEDVMRGNIDKLRARYPEGFDPEKSLHRKPGDL